MSNELLNFAPTNGRWVDDNGRLTANAQIWLRELWRRTGWIGGSGSTTIVKPGPVVFLGGEDGADGDAGFPIPGPAGPAGQAGAQGPAVFFIGDDGADGEMGPPGPAGQGIAVDSYVLASDEATAADTNPISLTDLAWPIVAGATYAFKFVGNVSPATATTGCGFQLLIT